MKVRGLLLAAVVAVGQFVGAGATRAAGPIPVRASARTVQAALFAAGGVGALSHGASAPVELVLNDVLQQTYDLNPFFNPTTAACEIAQLRQTWTSGQPSAEQFALEGSNQRIITVLRVIDPAGPPSGICAAGASPWSGNMGTALQAVAGEALDASANFAPAGTGFNAAQTDNGAGFTPSSSTLNTLLTGAFDPRQVLTDASDEASIDPQFGTAWNAIWGPGAPQTLNEGITASSTQLLAQDPALQGADVQAVSKLIGSGGTLNSDVTTLATDAQSDFAGLATTTTTAMQSPGESQPTYTRNGAQIQDAQSATEFLAALIATGDAVQGQVVAQASTTETAVANTANDWSLQEVVPSGSAARHGRAAAGTVSYGSIVNLGVDLATDNYVGAAMSLFNVFGGLFGAGGGSNNSSADALLAAEIGRLQNSLDAFAGEVQKDFQHLDNEIQNVYTALHNQLNTIANDLKTIQNDLNGLKSDIQNVYQGIQNIQVTLDQLQAQLYQKITDSTTGTEFWTDVDEYIPYQQADAQGQQMSSSDFHAADADFYAFVNPDATNSVALNTTAPTGDPSDAYHNLTTFTLDENVGYLGAFPGSVFGEPAWASPLVNPRWWAEAAQAYAQLLLSNPDYVTNVQLGRLGEMIGDGTTLRGALANASAANAASGTGNKLFNDLLGYYTTWSSANGGSLIKAIKALEQLWLAHQPAGWDPGVAGEPSGDSLQNFKLWGAANQTPDATPSITSVTCGGTAGLALPADASESTLVDNTFVNAMRLSLGTYGVSCTGTWSNVIGDVTHKSCTGTGNNERCQVSYYGDIAAELDWTYVPTGGGSLPIASVTATALNTADTMEGDRFFACTSQPYNPELDPPTPCVHNGNDASNTAGAWWSEYVSPALQGGTVTVDSANTPTVAATVSAQQTSLQKLLYTFIVGGNASWNQAVGCLICGFGTISSAITDLSGATTLIDSFAEFGLAPALADDDTLRSLLFGEDRLLDNLPDAADPSGRITAMYQAAEANPPAGQDETDIVAGQMASGQTALQNELSNVVKATGVDETPPLVASTLDRLTLTDTVLGWLAGQAPNQSGAVIGTATQSGAPGTPVPMLCVKALGSGGSTVESTFTGPNGVYSLPGLPPGTYTLNLSDCINHYYVTQFYSGSATAAAATPVVVGAGQPVALINQKSAQIVLGGRIAGTVTDNSATPKALPNICVAALIPSTSAQAGSTKTNAAGQFSLNALAPGQYNVHFSDCVASQYVAQDYGSDPVTVTAGATTGAVNAALAPAAPSIATPPSISGSPKDGVMMTAANGKWNSAEPITFTYAWQRCSSAGAGCTAISGATSQHYTAGSADVGHKLTVVVTATNAVGSGHATATPVGPVVPPVPPKSTGLPLIQRTGTGVLASHGAWSSPDTLTYGYQWQRCDGTGANCSAIAGATGTAYLVTSADAGHDLTVVVTATDQESQSQSATAKAVGPITLGTFSPPDPSALRLWVRADAIAQANATAVTSWHDGSSFANSLTATGSPTLLKSQFDGWPAVSFASSSYFTAAKSMTAGSGPYDVFVVGEPADHSARYGIVAWGKASTDGEVAFRTASKTAGDPADGLESSWFGNDQNAAATVSSSGPSLLESFYDGTNRGVRLDGQTLVSAAVSGKSTVASPLTVGADLPGADEFKGTIAEVLVYEGALTGAQQAGIDDYLASKYGITLS